MVVEVAKKVDRRANLYNRQLASCQDEFKDRVGLIGGSHRNLSVIFFHLIDACLEDQKHDGKKVLIVDDEFSIRDMLRMALEIADFECIEARTFRMRTG